MRDVDQPGMVSFITQDGFILDPEFPAAGDATDFPIVAHYVKQLDSAYATDGQGVVLNLEQRTLSAHPGTAPEPEGARVVGRRQGRITHTGSQAIVLNCDAGDVRLRLRYQALDDQPVGEQLLSFSQFEFILSMEGTELVFDALPWLESPDLALRGGQGQLRCRPGFPPHITSRDGYQLSWIGEDGFTFRPAPGHQAIIEQALALRDEHRSIHGSAPEALINRFSAMEIGASTHEATVSLIRAPAPVIPWQAAGAMTLDARYRLLGAGSAHDDILIGATNEDALNLLLGHAGDDQLIAGASGGLLCGGDGADRYRIDLAMAMPESHYLDNLASDGTVDTLEVRGASAWRQLTLARAEDDLWLGMRRPHQKPPFTRAGGPQHYGRPNGAHLALELTGSDGTLRTRLSASELEQAALDGQTPTVVTPYPRPAALEQLISQMARMNATSPDADIRAQETITQPPAPAHLLMPT